MQLALELQLLELLKPSQERRLKPLVVALGLGPELGLQKESLDFEPALGLGLLQELRPLELMRLPGLELRQLRLVIELQRQLKLQLAQ